MKRCDWAGSEPLMVAYHDEEWGKPVHDDRTLFEFLILEGAQAGLMWKTILNKRNGYRKAFHNFDVKKITLYSEKDVQRLMNDASIVRNQLKIRATIKNAKAFQDIQKEFGSFDNYVWQFVRNKPIISHQKSYKAFPTTTKESDELSKDLKKRGMTFVGSTIMYAFMQAVGLVNDHTSDCFCKKS